MFFLLKKKSAFFLTEENERKFLSIFFILSPKEVSMFIKAASKELFKKKLSLTLE